MERASRLFAAQDGVALVAQLTAVGVSEGLIRQRIRTGEWQRLARGLLAIGAPETWRRRARAALLAAGPHALLSHASAARLHGLDGYDRDERLVLTGMTGHQIRSLPGVAVHRSTLLTTLDRHEVDGLACVTRPLALIQIAAVDGRDRAGQALDSMLRDGNSPEWVRHTATRWRRHGVPGPAMVFDLLHERVDARLPRSWFQRLAKRAIAARGVATVDELPVHHHDGHRLAVLDLAIPDLRIGWSARAGGGTPRRLPALQTPHESVVSACSAGRSSRCGGPTSTAWTKCSQSSGRGSTSAPQRSRRRSRRGRRQLRRERQRGRTTAGQVIRSCGR